MRVRGAIALASTSVALTSCCLEVAGFDENAGTSVTSGGASTGSGSTSGGGMANGSTTTGANACHAGASMPGFVTTVAGGGDGGALGAGGVLEAEANGVRFGFLEGVALDSVGNVYVSDYGFAEVDRIDCAGNISLLAMGVAGIEGIASAAAGDAYLADSQFDLIRKIDSSGNVTTVAGTGLPGWADGSGGDDGTAEFNHPQGVAIDSSGNIYVADTGNNRIRKIDPSGNVTTLAGNGDAGYADGTGGSQGAAQFNSPVSVAVDGSGNVYVADLDNQCIRKLDPSGNVTTLAGNPSSSPSYVDGTGGPNGTAKFWAPWGVAVDGNDNVFVADSGNNRVRKIDASGNVTTLAGNGTPGFADGTLGPTGTAEFWDPRAVAVDASGNVFVADMGNARIRMITR